MALIDKLTAIADGFRASRGTEQEYSLDEMAVLAAEEVGGSGGSGDGTPKAAKSLVNITASTRILFPSGVEYYYNHEQLPEIPDDVVENYPYIFVVRSPSNGRIYASKQKPYTREVDGVLRLSIPEGGRVRYTYNASADAWVLDAASTDSAYFNLQGQSAWAVWWSNYDIPNGSADAEEIYFPASQPQAEQPADATHFYYNGVRLPVIPQTVRENYTNYWIHRSVSGGYYRLICSNSVWYVGGDPIGIRDTATIDDVRYNITDAELSAGGDWKELAAGNYYYTYEEGDKFPLWTVQNIMNGSADATEVYFYGTLAVPDPN